MVEREGDYKNAITNELFLTLAALLAARVPASGSTGTGRCASGSGCYGSGLIGPSGLVNDGLTAACANNGGTTWTYNQGVILGGLAALHEVTGDGRTCAQGEAIADAALRSLTGPPGILAEPGEGRAAAATATCRSSRASSSATCRTLPAQRKPEYRAFILANATPSWRTTGTSGPVRAAWAARSTGRTARQGSAVDVLIAAVGVTGL